MTGVTPVERRVSKRAKPPRASVWTSSEESPSTPAVIESRLIGGLNFEGSTICLRISSPRDCCRFARKRHALWELSDELA